MWLRTAEVLPTADGAQKAAFVGGIPQQASQVAAKCYRKGGAFEKEKLVLAHSTALNMKSKKVSPMEKQVQYLELAKIYLECNELKLSLKCLSYAKEFHLSAQLCERLGQIRDAAYFYKRSQCYKDAFRCFEQIQEFDLALKMYFQEELFEEAAIVVEKWFYSLPLPSLLPACLPSTCCSLEEACCGWCYPALLKGLAILPSFPRRGSLNAGSRGPEEQDFVFSTLFTSFEQCREERGQKKMKGVLHIKTLNNHRSSPETLFLVSNYFVYFFTFTEVLVYEEMPRVKTIPMLSYSASQLYLEAAAKYLSANNIKKMMAVLSKLDIEDQLVFLKFRKRLAEATDLLNRKSRKEEAALLMKLTVNKDFQAACLLGAAHLNVARGSDAERTKAILREALELCYQTNQLSGIAEAQFLQGVLLRDFQKLKEAFLNWNGGTEKVLVLALAPGGLQMLLNLVSALRRVTSNVEKEIYCQIAHNDPGPILIIFDLDLNLREKKTKEHFLIMTDQVELALNKHLLNRLCQITQSLLGKTYPGICTRFIVGLKCEDENCEDFHRPLRHCEAKCLVQSKLHLVAINGLLLEAKKVFPKILAKELEEIDCILSTDTYSLCKSFLNVLFPKHFHQTMLSENPMACKEILKPGDRAFQSYRFALKWYIHFLFQKESAQNCQESTDLWLRAMQAFLLSSNYPEELEKLLHKEEDSYNRELRALELEREERGWGRRSRMKGIEGKFGMLAPKKDEQSAEKTHLCFVHLLENCMDQFYMYRNP
ncbi:LOW QUALITY PROTEIN: hypothetical protein MC885_002547 [Smutsia gigantea]|nr:LOW QUALITY PROTEIN: hypothetical protein MC885_002547 [Smutsia gigantea]